MTRNHIFLRVVFCLAGFFCARCNHDKANNAKIPGNAVLSIPLLEYDSNSVERFDHIFDKPQLLYLQTPDSLLTASIDKILVYQGMFFILDGKFSSLLCFDQSGSFVRQYGKVGLSENEFKAIQDFDIDSVKNELVIFSNEDEALYHYRLNDGSFIRKEYIGIFAAAFALLPFDQIIFYVSYRLNPKTLGYNLIVLDSSRHVINKFLPFNPNLSSFGWKFSGFLDKSNNGILFTDAFNDSIFSYREDTFSLFSYIDINSDSIQKIRLDHKKLFSSGILLDTTTSFLRENFLYNNNYLILGYQNEKRIKTAVYTIKDKSIHILTSKDQDDPLLILAGRALYLSADNILIFAVSPRDISDLENKKPAVFNKLPTYIKDQVIHTDPTSNFYLLITKLKE